METNKLFNRRAIKISVRLMGILAVLMVIMAGCKKEYKVAGIGTEQEKAADLTMESTACGCWIAATNQANNQDEAYDPNTIISGTTNSWGTPKWSFAPTTARGYSATAEIPLWGAPADVKLRNTTAFAGVTQAIVTVGGRLATIAAYPSGNKIWTMGFSNDSPHVDMHSAELLPNGNIALASASRNWVRIYNSSYLVSHPTDPPTISEFPLISAHAVLWDPSIQRLWVIGIKHIYNDKDYQSQNQIITALKDIGTAAHPNFVEDTNYRTVLPGKYGHEISPYYYDNNKLWVAVQVDTLNNNKGVYIFNKTTKTFTPAPGAANRNFIKGVGNQPSGTIVEIRPQNAGGTDETSWQNDTVDFYSATGVWQYNRIKTGAKFYKIRVFDPDYQ